LDKKYNSLQQKKTTTRTRAKKQKEMGRRWEEAGSLLSSKANTREEKRGKTCVQQHSQTLKAALIP